MQNTLIKYILAALLLLSPTAVFAYGQGYYEGYYQGNYVLNNPAQNATLGINNIGWHYLSTYNGSSQPFDGLMSDVYFVDGQQLSPTAFGSFDANGYWKAGGNYIGQLGYAGFHLNFNQTNYQSFAASNGTVQVGPLYQTTTYRLICTAADIGSLVENDAVVTVLSSSTPFTFSACDSTGQKCTSDPNTPIFITSGAAPRLTWNASTYDANSCNVTSNNGGNSSTINGPVGTGTNYGGVSVTGSINEALSFNGSSTYAQSFTSPNTSVTNWSVAAWIKPAALNQLAMAVYNGNDSGGYGFGMGNGAGVAGSKLQLLFGGVAWLDTGYTFASANTWYHVVVTRDTTTTRVYVNGALLGTTFSNTPGNIVNNFTVGQEISSSGLSTRFFNGAVDDVHVYNRTITGGEVSTLYGLGSVASGQVLYWTLDAASISANSSYAIQPINTNSATNALAPAVTTQTTYTLSCLLSGAPVTSSLSVGVLQGCASGVGAAGSSCSSQCRLMEDTPQIESTGTLAPTSATISWCCPSAPAAGTNFATGGALSGTVSVAPSSNTTYSLSCPSGTATVDLHVIKPVPIVNSFSATRVRPGGQSLLSWTVARMAEDMSCSISPTPAGNQPSGSAGTWTGSTLTPAINRPTTFTLTCGSDEAGYVSTSATAGLLPTFKEK